MPRGKSIKPISKAKLVRMTVRIWEDDLEYLKAQFPDNYNAQIRRVINNWIREQESA